MLSTNTWQRKFGQLLKFWSFSHGDERTWTQHHLLCKDSAVAYFIACILIAQLLGGHRMIPHYNFFLKKVSRDMWCTIPWWWMIVREAGQVREKAGWVPWDSGSVDGVRPTRAYFRQPHKWGVRESPLPFLRTGGPTHGSHSELSPIGWWNQCKPLGMPGPWQDGVCQSFAGWCHVMLCCSCRHRAQLGVTQLLLRWVCNLGFRTEGGAPNFGSLFGAPSPPSF